MKLTVEPTQTQWTSRGTPMRLWHGTTDDGAPVMLAVVGVAAPEGAITDERLQAVPHNSPPPVDNCGPNGRTVVAANEHGDLTFGWWWV